MLQELIHRGGLHQALANRDDKALAPISTFIVKNICDPRFTNLLIDVTDILIEKYSAAIGLNPHFDSFLRKLDNKLKEEVEFQAKLGRVLGSVRACCQ